MKVILGAGKTALPGWVSTQETELNLLNIADFQWQDRRIPAL